MKKVLIALFLMLIIGFSIVGMTQNNDENEIVDPGQSMNRQF
ncbi:hypothetical protein SAMN05216389_11372 [Oceanobacillus limi]|uniref:Uncharacterized protein n=1 Tax=Oceanobacillus limi TaxID=930131 RepID=A0A1I0F1K6_9BACI|nr:hypothetical protein [Oceanobacillus limi]SET51751.1 hypothetical protein SAMN05216389_11372 [Oceanobacillus limi]